MADNRKYYYLKLKENFFDSDSIVLLEDMKDGILYSNILLKLYLKSLKNGGKLQLDEHIPYTAQMIATLTRHQIGTVERALEIFRQLGLVEQLDSGAFYMTDIELMIGQSSTEAERKRAARLENKALLPPRTKGGHLFVIGAAGVGGYLYIKMKGVKPASKKNQPDPDADYHDEDEDALQLPEDDGDEDEEVDVNEDYEAESDDEPV